MDQKKVGLFLKALRKERSLTQEALAEVLNVSARTVSRWETGCNMPDISLLVELAEFYQVGISEIIDGERRTEQMEKTEQMDQETRDTAVKLAAYSRNSLGVEKRNLVGVLLMAFAALLMISGFAVFPSESSWGSIFAIAGAGIGLVGVWLRVKSLLPYRSVRVLTVVGCAVALFGVFMVSDYIAVAEFQQVPRFSYEKRSGDGAVEHRTLFYTVVQRNPGTADERVEIVR